MTLDVASKDPWSVSSAMMETSGDSGRGGKSVYDDKSTSDRFFLLSASNSGDASSRILLLDDK